MSEYIVQSSSLTAVANKIREKTGDSAPLEFPDDFITAIDSIGSNPPATPSNSILFYAVNSFKIETKNRLKNWSGTIEFSTDQNIWTEWDGTTIQSDIAAGFYVLYLRGRNTLVSGDSGSSSDKGLRIIGSGIVCEGNLSALLDYETLPDTVTANAFKYLFYNCQNTDFDLVLPKPGANAVYCYRGIFKNCGSLTKAPVLDSTNLSGATGCYAEMFSGCISLEIPPALPATTLASECYQNMFSGCIALKTAPELPAMQMQPKCYQSMFANTGITTAPDLPATTLASNCYSAMFSNCASLTQIPALPATTLAVNCYENMFSSCALITQLPELPATTLSNYCYRYMFNGCTGIKLSTTQVDDYQTSYRIPYTGTGTTATSALSDFCNNTGGTFKGTPTINTPYYTSNTVVSAS